MFLKNNYILALLILLSFYSNAQSNTTTWHEILKSDLSTEQKTNKIDSIIEVHKNKRTDSILERLTHKYAIWLYQNKKIDRAIEIALHSLEIKKAHFSNDTNLIQLGLNNLAFYYYKNKNYPKSIQHYQEVLKLNSNNKGAANAYSEIGRCYRNMGDYYNSVTYFELAHSLLKKNKNYNKLIVNAINSGESYLQLNNINSFQRGFRVLNTADSLLSIVNSKQKTKYNVKLVSGNLYNQIKTLNPKKALFYYNQMLQIANDLNDSSKIANSYGLIGNLYNVIDIEQGIQYQKKALQYTRKDNYLQRGISYLNIASCLIQQKKIDEGIKYYYKGICFLGKNKNIINSQCEIDQNIIYETQYKSFLLNALKSLTDAYLKRHKVLNDKESLFKAINYSSLADELIDLMRIESQEFQSKLYWREQSADLYGKAVEACFLAKDPDHAFYFMEKNKALLLCEDINNSRIRELLELPSALVNQEIALKKSIYALARNEKNAAANKDAITITLLDKKRQLQQLQDSIQLSFPDYNRLDFGSSVVSLKNVQENLDDDTIILEYNISEHNNYGLISKNPSYTPIYENSTYGVKTSTTAYLLYISKKEVKFVQLETADLKRNITSLVQQASKTFKTKGTITSYNTIAYKVFDQLFPTQAIKEAVKTKKIKIVPDNYLNYLPFEALITVANSAAKPHYLIEDCEISYLYSNSFIENTKSVKNSRENSLLGVAPRNFDTYGLISLDNSVQELSNIKDSFDGELYIDDRATKEEFLNAISNHNIIHLATHADALDSISPWIAFRHHKLNLEELYFTKNSADMVVLSGCNTMQGEQKTGEGVMSLARGFFHSGAKSVVSSLWNVDDRSATYIMKRFYKNLKQGQSKSRALRDAKLEYLQNHSLSEASPHFWATFVISGDTSPLQTTSLLSVYWLFLLIPTLIIVVFFYRKRKK